MPTNSQFTVATHILALMAMHDRPLASRLLSQSVNTNPVVVRRIIGALQDAHLVETTMGVEGGTRLLRPPREITLLDVYRATGQGRVLALHSSPPNPACEVGANIQPTLGAVFDRAQAALEAELAAVTVADVAADIAQRAGGAAP